MKNATLGLVLISCGIALSAGGCGSDEPAEPTSSGNGGATSSGAGGKGGTTGSGGATGTGGTAGKGGTTGTGGTTGGTTGTGGTGGTGSAMCPATEPVDGDPCTVETPMGEDCAYTGVECDCDEAFGGGDGGDNGGDLEWDCDEVETGGGGGGGP